MADYAFCIMVGMLVMAILSAGGALAVAVFAAILVAKPNTRRVGIRILLAGLLGVLLTDSLVFLARENPAAIEHLPQWTWFLSTPFIWAFLTPRPALAYATSSIFGFAWAGGVGSLVAIFSGIRHLMRRPAPVSSS